MNEWMNKAKHAAKEELTQIEQSSPVPYKEVSRTLYRNDLYQMIFWRIQNPSISGNYMIIRIRIIWILIIRTKMIRTRKIRTSSFRIRMIRIQAIRKGMIRTRIIRIKICRTKTIRLSITSIYLSCPNKMFSGLMSRCITFIELRYSRAETIWTNTVQGKNYLDNPEQRQSE